MPESITLFGRELPVYGLCYVAGIFLAAGVALLLSKKRGFDDRWEIAYSAIYTMIGGLVGAKLLYILVSLRQIIEQQVPLIALLQGGFVFYGGVLGGMLGLLIYCKVYKTSFWQYADLFAVVLPLGHAVGRVGCFAAGCCYGIEYDGPLSYTYPPLHANPDPALIGVSRLPIQLIEAAVLLLLFAGMLATFLRHPTSRQRLSAQYVLAYSIVRFTLEFFRGDVVRGLFWGLSTSQWISLAAAVIAVIWLILRHRRSSEISSTEV